MDVKTVQGAPCKRGHSGLRYAKGRTCVQCVKDRLTSWRAENPLAPRRQAANLRARDPDKYIEATRRYRRNKPEATRRCSKQWKKANRKKATALENARRAAKGNRTPAWANLNAIKAIYENCPEGMAVDHYYPLKGKTVSGLHVENNLTYLTPLENSRKANRHPEDYYAEEYTP